MRLVPLKFSIPLALLVLGSAAIAIDYAVSLRHQHDQMRAAARSALNSRGNYLAGLAQHLLQRGDRQGASLAVSLAGLLPGIQRVALVDPSNRMLWSNEYQWRGYRVDESPLAAALPLIAQVRANTRGELIELSADSTLVGAYPFAWPSEPHELKRAGTGIVVVQQDLAPAFHAARQYAMQMALETGIALVAVCLLLWVVLSRLVTRRADRLIATTRALANGDLSARSGLPPGDELAEVSAALDQMGAALAQREATLRENDALKRTQRELQETNERLERTLAATNIGTWERNLRTGELTWDDRQCAIYGLAPSCTISFDYFLAHVHPDDVPRVRAALAASLASGTEYVERYRFVRDDGKTIWIYARGGFRRDAAGSPTHLVGINMDITDRIVALEAIEEREQRLRAIFDGTCELIGLLSPAGVLLAANRAALAFAAVAEPAVVGKAFWDTPWWAHSDAQQARLRAAVMQAAQGNAVRFDAEHLRHDGTIEAIDFSLQPIKNAQGEVVLLVPEGRIVTEQHRAEAALSASEERFRLASEAVHGGIYDWDLRAGAVLRSRDSANVLGFAGGELDPNPAWWSARIHPEDIERVRAEITTAFKSVATEFSIQYRIRHQDGHWVWAWDQGRIVRDADSRRVVRVVGHVIDISVQKQLEEALQDADRRKDLFLATLAHELRNPLTPLRNAVTLLTLPGLAPAEVEWARDMLDRQVGHMGRLIDDLLDVSRIARDKLVLRKERIELLGTLRRAIDTCQPMIQSLGHTLTVSLPQGSIYVNGDADRLVQVFSNVLTNAAKFTPRDGQIRVTAAVAPGPVPHAIVQVADSGIGITAAQLPHLFEMFYQGEGSRPEHPGLGIGLSLVKRLVELHEGTVQARSAGTGKGSEFVVSIPILSDQTVLLQHDTGDGMRLAAQHRVLVVDDNRDSAESLATLLRLDGHQVASAYDGEHAIVAAQQFRPDIALLDIGLPKLNGYEVARALRRELWGRDVFLIALTGWGQERDKRMALDAGFDVHLTKPLDYAAFNEIVTTHFARSAATQHDSGTT